MATSAGIKAGKRRRHDGGGGSSLVAAVRGGINDLPDALLANVATFLSKTTCALFATAISESKSSNLTRQPSSASMVIVSQYTKVHGAKQWESLDFMDIEKTVRVRLTDGDVGGMLLCINAVPNLKSLKLTHCFAITGACLETLGGSMVLERIDLSLVEQHESPVLVPEPSISEAAVFPILDIIIRRIWHGSIVHVQLPKKWRRRKSEMLRQFLEAYDRELNRSIIECSLAGGYGMPNSCVYRCRDSWFDLTESCWSSKWGIPSLTCYQCLRHFCVGCISDSRCLLAFCSYCEKYLCIDCNFVYNCQGSSCLHGLSPQMSSCNACAKLKKCDSCPKYFCSEPSCNNLQQCELCGCVRCDECSRDTSTGFCSYCEKYYCSDCVVVSHCHEDPCRERGSPKIISCKACAKLNTCDSCSKYFCSDCNDMRECGFSGCFQCDGGHYCDDCSNGNLFVCESECCNKSNCHTCAVRQENGFLPCLECQSTHCPYCKMQKYKEDCRSDSYCQKCASLIPPALLEENKYREE